jgi:hypothetical protein
MKKFIVFAQPLEHRYEGPGNVFAQSVEFRNMDKLRNENKKGGLN